MLIVCSLSWSSCAGKVVLDGVDSTSCDPVKMKCVLVTEQFVIERGRSIAREIKALDELKECREKLQEK